MLEEKVYMNNPHSLEELQANIRHEISAIPVQQFKVFPEVYSHNVRHV
jgi:hypothetical protein